MLKLYYISNYLRIVSPLHLVVLLQMNDLKPFPKSGWWPHYYAVSFLQSFFDLLYQLEDCMWHSLICKIMFTYTHNLSCTQLVLTLFHVDVSLNNLL